MRIQIKAKKLRIQPPLSMDTAVGTVRYGTGSRICYGICCAGRTDEPGPARDNAGAGPEHERAGFPPAELQVKGIYSHSTV